MENKLENRRYKCSTTRVQIPKKRNQ